MDFSCTEKGSVWHAKVSFELEPPRTTKKRNTEKGVEEKDREGSWVVKTWKEVKAIAGRRVRRRSFVEVLFTDMA
jgi:hypothetical protein